MWRRRLRRWLRRKSRERAFFFGRVEREREEMMCDEVEKKVVIQI